MCPFAQLSLWASTCLLPPEPGQGSHTSHPSRGRMLVPTETGKHPISSLLLLKAYYMTGTPHRTETGTDEEEGSQGGAAKRAQHLSRSGRRGLGSHRRWEQSSRVHSLEGAPSSSPCGRICIPSTLFLVIAKLSPAQVHARAFFWTVGCLAQEILCPSKGGIWREHFNVHMNLGLPAHASTVVSLRSSAVKILPDSAGFRLTWRFSSLTENLVCLMSRLLTSMG